MLRTAFFSSLAVAIGLTGFAFLRPVPSSAQPIEAAANHQAKANGPSLPLSHVVLFSSGVGYFQREGEVDGNAKVDLSFPATDINDLIKSLVLQDMGNGKIASINYDSQDPIDRTLRTFALDLTANPSLGQLLNQARGEKVEVTMLATAAGQPATLTGTIVGMESQRQPQGKEQVVDVDVLNLLSAEGLRGVQLSQVQRVRFISASIDAELRRALELIAGARDHQKKAVSLSFRGEGKRKVLVGYVVESPLWKTSYRLVVDGSGKAKLQGWAVVENTTDDDWTNVKMALVSGRPISYQMDLYPPLYVPRPTVEPEKFASLRPPTYGGAMTNPNAAPTVTGLAIGGGAGVTGGGGGSNAMDDETKQRIMMIQNGAGFNRYQGQLGFGGGNNQTNLGFGGGNNQTNLGFGGGTLGNFQNDGTNNRLSFEQLKQRQQEKGQAKEVGKAIAMLDASASVASVASAEDIGDVCQYAIEDRVNLPRQKSAMLPIVQQVVDAAKVSIFNESVHAKYPLLGLRFRNTSAQSLMQGPITVYEGSSYAGDSRLQDLQPGEERLLSYALDLGTEVKADGKVAPEVLDAVKVVKGVLLATHKHRMTRAYLIKNRSTQERTLLVEHPVRDDWKLVAPEKPAERSRDTYRFAVTVPAGQSHTLNVVEEQRSVNQVKLGESDETSLRLFIRHSVPSAKLKESLEKLIALKNQLADMHRELAQAQEQLKAIAEDQTRLRSNFEKLPATSAAYKRYLEKFDSQESEIEKLQAGVKEKQVGEKELRKKYEEFLAGMNVDA